MNILLACNGGVSTGILADKMMKLAKEKGTECRVWAVDDGQIEQEIQSEKVDVILLGPQVKYKMKAIKKELDHYGIPIDCMNPIDYGMNHAANILKFAEEKARGEK